jgi:hypothetical protein
LACKIGWNEMPALPGSRLRVNKGEKCPPSGLYKRLDLQQIASMYPN